MKKKLNCILLVDDDKATNFLHKKIIGNNDVSENILVALNGKEAMIIICNALIDNDKNNTLPELVFLDINMPIMNGWEFMEEYQKLDESKKSKIIIIMLTSSINTEDEIKARKFPEISGFLNKPLKTEMLNNLLKEKFNFIKR